MVEWMLDVVCPCSKNKNQQPKGRWEEVLAGGNTRTQGIRNM